jgi:pimeloyl-ACP methyl ester carboxylesterase
VRPARGLWARIRRIWAIAGVTAFVVFTGWSLLAFRANAAGRAALGGNERAGVERGDGFWLFRPRAAGAAAGLLFFPGGLVEPAAYAPLALEVASAGFTVALVELPRRGAFGGAESPEVFSRAAAAIRTADRVASWLVAGHSRGGAVAARAVHERPSAYAGLILIGTSHPRDFSLRGVGIPVTRIYGTRDTIADPEKLEAARPNLPAHTRDVRLDGGNHSQFGAYGFQPGDWPATISRQAQHEMTREAVLRALRAASGAGEGR